MLDVQIEAWLEWMPLSSVIADFRDRSQYADAVQASIAAGVSILLATPRIQKPGESRVFRELAERQPRRPAGAEPGRLGVCRRNGMAAVADFSLNAANDLTVRWLFDRGARRVTPAYDLSRERLLSLAEIVPAERLEVVVHRHTPMFDCEYCLFCASYRKEAAAKTGGRPCDRHAIRLRDRKGRRARAACR